jgi:hypothetical protein
MPAPVPQSRALADPSPSFSALVWAGIFNPDAELSADRFGAKELGARARFRRPPFTGPDPSIEVRDGATVIGQAGPEPKDYVLSILGAEPERPVKGTLMLVKLTFLVSREIDTRAAPEFKFFAFDYGPYSKILMATVDQLVEERAVLAGSTVTDLANERREYRLSESGKSLAKRSLDLLGPDIAGRLQKLRKGADQLGYNGILRLVYTRYPEFATASKIRQEVLADPDRR